MEVCLVIPLIFSIFVYDNKGGYHFQICQPGRPPDNNSHNMQKYQFHQDIKCTVWQRQFFEIEAESQDEAKRIAMQFKDVDVSSMDCMTGSEWLLDQEELMTVDENDGYETIQLYAAGEEYPFVTNGSEVCKLSSGWTDQFKDIMQVAFGEMGKYTIECSYQGDNGLYQAFHADGKLVVVHLHTANDVVKYTFGESWDSLVTQNEAFRGEMVKFLLNEGGNYPPSQAEIHDWLGGHLTSMVFNAAVDDCVPFTLQDVVDVWGSKVSKYHYQPAKLIGWQVSNADGRMPDGMTGNQVIQDKQKATGIFEDARKTDKRFRLYPVYEDEVPNPHFV